MPALLRRTSRRAGNTRPIADQVVVITGASSGIGRVTAHELAARGARVVLAARDEAELQDLAAEVRNRGGVALVVPTDVSSWEQVQHLAELTCATFGRIDTWVNNAAVSAYGALVDLPVDAVQRVVRVGVEGHLHGLKAALPVMRAQGGGTMIGVTSALGLRAMPLQAPYCAAKFALTGLYESVRAEERLARSGVAVTTILPPTVGTPFYDSAPSWLDAPPPLIPPVYAPEVVAHAIVHAATSPVRRIPIGVTGFIAAGQRLSPTLMDEAMLVFGRLIVAARGRSRPGERATNRGLGNLHHPAADRGTTTVARDSRSWIERSWSTRTLGYHPAVTRAVVAGAALLTVRARRTRTRPAG